MLDPILPADGAAPLDPVGAGDAQPSGVSVEPVAAGVSRADAGAGFVLGGPGLAASTDRDGAAGVTGAHTIAHVPAGSGGAIGGAAGSTVAFGGSVVSGGAASANADGTARGGEATAVLDGGWTVPAGVVAASGDTVTAGAAGGTYGGDAGQFAPVAGSAGDVAGANSLGTGAAETGTGSPAAALAGGGLIINLVYDAQTLANAPASFFTGMQDAANLLEAAIANSIIVNIEVGYGEFEGTPLQNQNISEGDINNAIGESYFNLRTLLANNETSSADIVSVNDLPNTTALNGVSNLIIGSAQAKALGTLAANDTAIDGFVGMGTGFAGNTLIGGALHEITHAMGRIDGASGLSLFRYTSPGSHDFSSNIPTAASYFSIDGGVTALTSFGVNSDPSDFLNSSPQVPNDPFDETIAGSKLTSIDLAMMDVLGFEVTATNFTVSAGHTDSGIIVNSGDNEFVKSGGISVAAYALSGGVEIVSAGGADRAARLGSGAEQFVFGSARFTVVNGGTQVAEAGGVVSGGTVSSGGGQYTNPGGAASGTTIRNGGFQAVYGGTATGTVVSYGGGQFVASGGKALGAIVRNGGLQDVFSAGTSSRTIISRGGSETVSSGSIAIATTINNGGGETVSVGGVASGGTVASGGVERVYGRANGGAVASGGRQYLSAGGVASGVTVKAGGIQAIFAGGTARRTVLSGGTETVHGKAIGGTIHGGLFEVASGGTASGFVSFVSGGTLQLDAGAGFTGVIKGFAVPDRIDLRGIAFGAGTTKSFTEAASHTSGTLTVTSGTHTVHLTLLGVYSTSNFNLATDNHGGTLVTDPPLVAAAPRLTFTDITPARLRVGAATPRNPSNYIPGAIAANEEAHAGQTLLATGPPGAADGGDHHPLLPAPR